MGMPEMRNLRLTVEYDGRDFHGWQRQARERTVQGELEAALSRVLQQRVTLYAAGRTDAGVHALGQVAHLHTENPLPPERLVAGCNALTGNDVVVLRAREVGPDFHARYAAHARHYVYLMLDRPSALWRGRATLAQAGLHLQRLNAAARYLMGQHEFAAFSCRSADEESTDSHVFYARWERWSRGVALRIGAVRFLYKMVRCIVGRSLEVGAGREAPERFAALLRTPRERGRSIAPPDGCYLVAVDYDPREAARWGPDCLPPWPVL
ncbi:MAG: tRNA pseudouridine(38-40) synthase TruA [Candidatus Eisenbacteria bacterium]|nr:tRNA pseudouridine(38-40) synthase TruA [Candidatus Eisenbacteria bacterium]